MSPRSNLLFLCLIGLSFVLDQFGFNVSADCLIAAAWAAAIPAIAGAVGSIGSGIMNLFSQADANAANKEIAAQNREWQSGENSLNRQWQENMWNAQNAYNTPSAMKARLKEAGWNPFLSNSEVGSSSNAGAAGSPSMQSAPNQPDIKPMDYGFIGDAAQNAANSYYQAKAVDANVANQTANADKQNLDNANEIQKFYGSDVAQSYLSSKIKQTQGLSQDGSLKARQNLADVRIAESEASLRSVNADLAQRFGTRRAEAEIKVREKTVDKIEQEINESVQRIAESKTNVLKIGSDIQVNVGKIKELLSEYYKNCAEAGMFRKLGDKYVAETSTIDGLREGLKTQLKLANDRNQMRYETESTIFESQEGARGYLTSKEGKEQIAIKAGADANAVLHIWRQINPIVDSYTPSFIVTEK